VCFPGSRSLPPLRDGGFHLARHAKLPGSQAEPTVRNDEGNRSCPKLEKNRQMVRLRAIR